MDQHANEVVVVTGASAGIGRATAKAFAKQGTKVGLLARSRDGLEGARREVEEAAVRVGLTPEEIQELIIHTVVYAGFPTAMKAMQILHRQTSE